MTKQFKFDVAESVKKAHAWLDSQEGKDWLSKVHETPLSDKIARARWIDPALLQIPLGPINGEW